MAYTHIIWWEFDVICQKYVYDKKQRRYRYLHHFQRLMYKCKEKYIPIDVDWY